LAYELIPENTSVLHPFYINYGGGEDRLRGGDSKKEKKDKKRLTGIMTKKFFVSTDKTVWGGRGTKEEMAKKPVGGKQNKLTRAGSSLREVKKKTINTEVS